MSDFALTTFTSTSLSSSLPSSLETSYIGNYFRPIFVLIIARFIPVFGAGFFYRPGAGTRLLLFRGWGVGEAAPLGALDEAGE
jgi:hypothetical protein